MGRLKGLIEFQCLLALLPLAHVFTPIEDPDDLLITWTLFSFPFAQIMLLAIYVGMTREPAHVRFGRAIGGVCCLAIPFTMIAWLMTRSPSDWNPLGTWIIACLLGNAMLLALVAVMRIASRLIGTIEYAPDVPWETDSSRIQFSLFAILGVTTTVALVLMLSETATINGGFSGAAAIALIALWVAVFTINMLTAIWAALGAGQVRLRMLIVYVVSGVLAIALGRSSVYTGGMRAFFLQLILAIVSPSIVVFTLLHLRKLGYRLIRSAAAPVSAVFPGEAASLAPPPVTDTD